MQFQIQGNMKCLNRNNSLNRKTNSNYIHNADTSYKGAWDISYYIPPRQRAGANGQAGFEDAQVH